MTEPLKPQDVGFAKEIPDIVMEIFNKEIAKRWDGDQAIVIQNIVVPEIVEQMKCTRQDVFDKHWLYVEDKFRAVGWEVTYCKPMYYAGEDSEAFYTFRKKK